MAKSLKVGQFDPGPEHQFMNEELIAELHDSLLDHAAHSKLTKREVEVVTLLLTDLAVEDVAEALGIDAIDVNQAFEGAVRKMRFTLLAELHAAQMCPRIAQAEIPNLMVLPIIASKVGLRPLTH